MKISEQNLEFLKALAENNNRDWFETNKKLYQQAQENTILFADAVLEGLRAFDEVETPSGKKSLMRIYRDVRFSQDKRPYKNNWGGSFSRLGQERRGGFYYHIEPGKSFIGGGFWNPEKDDLYKLRTGIAHHQKEFEAIVLSKNFKSYFGELGGEKLKTAPKGFDKSHPAIDWLNHKQFLLMRPFSDKEVLSIHFAGKVVDSFVQMLPFFHLMGSFLQEDKG